MANREEAPEYGKCRLDRVIGRGANSTVYLAWHQALNIPVALKVIDKPKGQEDQGLSLRVTREAQIAAQLTHASIVRIYDCGETADSYFLVLQYIEGETCLDTLNRDGPFEWRRAVEILRQVADGLSYAHQRGVIHRDLKPQNIMVDRHGDARLADLGLAKVVAPGQASETLRVDVLGTPHYMSPEQVKQPGQVDFRSDIYSFGATLYHMTTGVPPFDGATPYEIMAKHLDAPLTSPREIRPDLPEPLCALIARSMAKSAQDRYQSYDELVADLEGLLREEALAELAAPSAREPEAGPRQERQEPAAPAPPVQPDELPVTVQNMQAKIMGFLALLVYSFWLVSLYHVLLSRAGLIPAITGAVGMVALSVGWSVLALRRGAYEANGRLSPEGREALARVLGRLCERLALPTPRLHVSRRRDNASFAYNLPFGEASVDLPGGWLKGAGLTEQETEAFVAQSLGGVYCGDSSIRALVALPVELLKIRTWFVKALLNLVPSMSASWRLRVVHALTVTGVAGLLAVIVVLLWVSVWGSVLAMLLVGVLLLVAGFERSARYAEDAFAAKVTGKAEVVKSLIAVSGLTGEEGFRLRLEAAGLADAAGSSESAAGQEARPFVENVVAHYGRAEYAPGPLEKVRLLFSHMPSAATRLNRTAGVGEKHAFAAAAIPWAEYIYTALTGKSEGKQTMPMRELAAIGSYQAVGTIDGAMAVPMLALLLPWGVAHYAGFLVLLAIVGSVSGLLLSVVFLPGRLSVGRFGWAVVVTSVFFTCTSMLGLCLVGGRTLSLFAFHFPVSLVIVSFFAFSIGAASVRWREMLRARKRRGSPGARTGSGHGADSGGQKQEPKQAKQRSRRVSRPGGEDSGGPGPGESH